MLPATTTETFVKQAISYANGLDRFAVALLNSAHASQSDHLHIFCMASAVRSLNYFRAVVKLIEFKLYEPAGASLRVMLELIFVLSAVHKCPELLDLLATQSIGERRKALSSLMKVSIGSRSTWLTNDVILAELEGLDPQQGFNAAFWAEKSGNSETYNTMYRRLNSLSHGALGALEGYLPVNERGQFTSVRNDVGKERAIQFLVTASSILIDVLQIIDKHGSVQSRSNELARFESELLKIHGEIPFVDDDVPPSKLVVDP